jgi:hypothetical protein
MQHAACGTAGGLFQGIAGCCGRTRDPAVSHAFASGPDPFDINGVATDVSAATLHRDRVVLCRTWSDLCYAIGPTCVVQQPTTALLPFILARTVRKSELRIIMSRPVSPWLLAAECCL